MVQTAGVIQLPYSHSLSASYYYISSSFTTIFSSSCRTLDGISHLSALSNFLCLIACVRHSFLSHRYAPLPGILPEESSRTSPVGVRTILTSVLFSEVSLQAIHVLIGTFRSRLIVIFILPKPIHRKDRQ